MEAVTGSGMTINTGKGKTEFILVARNIEKYKINLKKHQTEQVTDYKYLGVNRRERNMQEVKYIKE